MKVKKIILMVMGVLLMSSVSLVPLASAPPPFSATIYMVNINHHALVNFWGVSMDSVQNTAAWHIRAAIAHLLDKQEFLNTYAPGLTAIDNPLPKSNPLYTAWYFNWGLSDLLNADPLTHSQNPVPISLYNNVALSPDIFEARDHLVAAGMGWVDNNGDGVIDNPPTSQIDFYVPSGTISEQLGLYLEANINIVFGQDVVNLIPASMHDILDVTFFNTIPDDWHLSIFGWTLPKQDRIGDWFYVFHSNSITNPPTWENYIYYSNPTYDSYAPYQSPPNARNAQETFGKTVGTIPVFSL